MACGNENKQKEIELVKVRNNSDKNTYCSLGKSKYFTKIKNLHNDTLVVSFPSHTEGKCYVAIREEFYNFNTTKDSIYFYSTGIGDNWGTPKYDTILPKEVKYYYSDIEWSHGGHDFIRLGYPYYKLGSMETNPFHFTLLIYHDKKNKEFEQVDFYIPNDVDKFKSPSSLNYPDIN